MSRTSDAGRYSGYVQGAPLELIADPRSYSQWWGRTTATSNAGGLTAVVSSTLISSRSLFRLCIEAQGSVQAVPASPMWCVATLSETSSGGFVRFSTIGSFSYSGSWTAICMWELGNHRLGRAQT